MKYINKIDSISQDLFYHALESLRLIPIGGEIIFLAEGIEIPPPYLPQQTINRYIEYTASK